MQSPIPAQPYSPPRSSPSQRQRHISAQDPWLRLAGHVDHAAVQEQLARTPTFLSRPGLAHVDLADATSFDLTGLIVLLAAVSDRVSAAARTKFRLPTSDLARHVLRMWGFPAAASVITQAPFRALVEKSDLEYFGEIWPRMTSSFETSPTHYLMAQKPFGLSAYRINDAHGVLQIMDDEIEHWRSYAVTKLLERFLSGKTVDDISRVIIQELISNILEHPGASVEIIAALLDNRQDLTSTTPRLIITLWDDGASIIDTLRACIRSETQEQSLRPDSREIFKIQEGSWTNGRLTYSSDWLPDSDAADPEILLSSLYIGIRPLRLGQRFFGVFADGPTLADGPEGLLPLYRTVLHHFGGNLEIKSKASTVNLTANSKQSHYKVKLTVDDQLSPISGNLVTVKLPVIDA